MDDIRIISREPNTVVTVDEELFEEEMLPSEEPEQEVQEAPKRFSLDTLSRGILVVLVFLLPFFVLPLSGTASELWKMFLVVGSTITVSLLWLLERLRSGSVPLPRTPFLFFIFLVPFILTLSSVFSGAFTNSFFGSGIDPDASAFLLLLFSLTFLIFVLSTKGRVQYFLKAFLAGAFVLLFYQIFFLIFPEKINFFGWSTLIDNLLGRWSNLGIFSALTLMLLLILQPRKFQGRKISTILFLLPFIFSLVFVCLALPKLFFIPLGLLSLFLVSYTYFYTESRSSALFPLIVLVVSVIFTLSTPFHDKITSLLSIPPVREVSPSLTHTVSVMKSTFAEGVGKTALGSGPNRFAIEWQKYRPVVSAETVPLSMGFMYGSSFLATTIITSGVLGFIAWCAFIFIFIAIGGYVLYMKRDLFKENEYGKFVLASWVGATFLWLVLVVANPGVTLIILAFIFTGLSLAGLSDLGAIRVRLLSFAHEPRLGFFSVTILLVLMGIFIGFSYKFINLDRALFAYRGAVISANSGNLEQAEAALLRATALSPYDAFYRSLSDLSLAQLGNILNRRDMGPDDLRIAFQSTFERTVSSAKKATEADQENYANWVTYGNVFAAIAPLHITGLEQSYDLAKAAYEKALSLNPLAPDLYLTLARLDLSSGKKDTAKSLIGKALSISKNTPDAYVLLAGIQEGEGKTRDAIKTLEQAIVADPQNIGLLFQLGFLRYQSGDYVQAISALERAVAIHPPYANAKYFLGLSYYKAGRTNDAIRQFQEVLTLNPDNAEVPSIIENLKAGKEPFSS